MTRQQLLRQIEAIINVDEATLTGAEVLEDLPDWDSLAILSIISLFDKDFGVVVRPATVYECRTVDAVMDLVGDRLSS